MEQRHLSHEDRVNLGGYYTPAALVDTVYALLERNVPGLSAYTVLDTSCGYGGFLRGAKAVGGDVDKRALRIARRLRPGKRYLCRNGLAGVSRAAYGLGPDEPLIIVGNPPYNDTTSLIRNAVKKAPVAQDDDLRVQDLGLSFLRSYAKLRADYICVLHPLSYLIKKANFARLGPFCASYRLTDALVVSSGEFSATSKAACFPIIIAFYARRPEGMAYPGAMPYPEGAAYPEGMTYPYIRAYSFETREGRRFSLDDFDTVDGYLDKYPNHRRVSLAETVAHFYTLRDVNALGRARTFVGTESGSTVRVTRENLWYYCYVDVFKDYLPHLPYYFGNHSVMLDHEAAAALRGEFLWASMRKHPSLGPAAAGERPSGADAKIDAYFRRLLGVHYGE